MSLASPDWGVSGRLHRHSSGVRDGYRPIDLRSFDNAPRRCDVPEASIVFAAVTMTASEVAQQVGCSASTLYRHVPGGRAAVSESGMPASI